MDTSKMDRPLEKGWSDQSAHGAYFLIAGTNTKPYISKPESHPPSSAEIKSSPHQDDEIQYEAMDRSNRE
jgi:hypothetical protein